MTKKAPTRRQKIPIAKIKNENHRQVTFSKRRAGLFKKASELCTLCGVETAIVVFSPAGKPFSFGHPSVESVINNYISHNNLPIPKPEENHRNAGLRDMNSRLMQVSNDLDAEKKKGVEIENIRKANRVGYWWERPVEEMNLEELENLQVALEDLKMNLEKHVDETKQVFNSMPFLEGGGGDVFSNFGRNMNVMNPNFSSSCNFSYGPSYMFDSRV